MMNEQQRDLLMPYLRSAVSSAMKVVTGADVPADFSENVAEKLSHNKEFIGSITDAIEYACDTAVNDAGINAADWAPCEVSFEWENGDTTIISGTANRHTKSVYLKTPFIQASFPGKGNLVRMITVIDGKTYRVSDACDAKADEFLCGDIALTGPAPQEWVECEFTSIWSDGCITTKAKANLVTKEVVILETVDPCDVGMECEVLEDECVTIQGIDYHVAQKDDAEDGDFWHN